jgi:hypothetical protein
LPAGHAPRLKHVLARRATQQSVEKRAVFSASRGSAGRYRELGEQLDLDE